jgi:hypothetical protein
VTWSSADTKRKKQKRREKIAAQVADGSLVIRQATVADLVRLDRERARRDRACVEIGTA